MRENVLAALGLAALFLMIVAEVLWGVGGLAR